VGPRLASAVSMVLAATCALSACGGGGDGDSGSGEQPATNAQTSADERQARAAILAAIPARTGRVL